MPQFFLNKRLIVLLVSIIILVALIGFSVREREKLSWPEQFLKDTTGFVQNIFHQPVQFVAGFVENVNDLQHTYQENKRLKTRLDEYVKLKTEVQELEKENVELRDILDKKESLRDFDPIQATIIARNPDMWHEKTIINRGKIHGVQKDMAVITSKGLIGKIKITTQFTSTVQLLSSMDPKNRISVGIYGKGTIYGFIEGFDQKERLLLMKKIPYDVKIKKGSEVVTSGLGGVFPRGLPVGKVEKVESDQYGLTQVAYVKPSAELYDLNHVIVVKRKISTTESSSGAGAEGDDL
ncbi:rod shape-determining protein MreC [Peribacillus deserti]|uniref:Cell shape-determining protein MreC n=1 Tax=Peribacillus deserti TaxID=673318 RepID=A0ABS2QFI9_9BACI|nr:rod shape-determining protein MreC [Peribacillus deserti]MBM7691921.1 rod shape-determining protein MreC [Peribacillus deserti]